MKKTFIILCTVLMIVGIAACSKQADTPEEKEEEVTLTAIPEELQGSYVEEIAGRGYMEVSSDTITI